MAKQDSEFLELKKEADNLGINYSPNIGKETLREKIKNFQLAQETINENQGSLTLTQREEQIRKEATKLVRIELINKNINKVNEQGTWLMAGNSLVGTLRKYVPFNQPWHVPAILVNAAEEKQFVMPSGKKNGRRWVHEYQVVYLDPITPDELEDLKHQQALKENQED